MKKHVFLIAALCAALLLCACGGQSAEGKGAAAPAGQAGAPAATPEPDFDSMTLAELAALPIEPELFLSLAMDRMPEVTFEEVKALGVLDEDMLAELFEYWNYLTSQMPAAETKTTPASDPISGVAVGLTQGTVSHQTGYAVQGGDTLSTEAGSFLELTLGEGNYIQLHANTRVTVNRFGDELRMDFDQGGLSFFFGAPEQLAYAPVCVNSLCSVDMQSQCGYISRPAGALWMKITAYKGQMTLRLKDGTSGTAADGVSTMVRGENEVTPQEAFSGKFEGMNDLILNHREMADALAEAYGLRTAEVLLTVGIRTEPEILIRDLGNGTYDREVIDVNGDVVESGRFNTEDDSVLSNTTYAYNENHQRIREERNAPGNYWDGKVTTWTYYDTGEVKTDSYTMPDGRFENREYDKQEHVILLESGVNGVVETHRETEYNEAGIEIHERTVGKDYIAESFYDDAGRQLRHVRTDREGNKINVFVYTYYENGQKATERTEDYSINGMWYETAYDEAGNVTSQESGKLE